jgi:N-acetylmuramoyl-L-alanine amidase
MNKRDDHASGQTRRSLKPLLGVLLLSPVLGGWSGGGPPELAASVTPPPMALSLIAVPVIQVRSPNHDARPAGTPIDTLVIHDTETPGVSRAATIANHFCNPRANASAHYIIGKAGEIIQCVQDSRRAWHAGPSTFSGRSKVNDFSIGIELVNAQTGRDPFTDAQYRSLIHLTCALLAIHPISLDRIVGHRMITHYPQYRRDPADNFDWRRYKDGIKMAQKKARVQLRPTIHDARQ